MEDLFRVVNTLSDLFCQSQKNRVPRHAANVMGAAVALDAARFGLLNEPADHNFFRIAATHKPMFPRSVWQ